jgi:hypothetical protein
VVPGIRPRALLALCASACAAVAAPVSARAEGPSFSITPTGAQPYFVFNASPGATVQGAARVVNASGAAGNVTIAAVDATTGQTSGAVYLSPTDPKHDVGAWVTVAPSQLTLAPHQSADVSFTVRVPAGARAGQHLGGLVATPSALRSSTLTHRAGHTFRVNVREISIVAVQVNLPGPPVQKVTVTGLTAAGRPGYQTLLIGISNAGNTLVKGNGRLIVSAAGGGQVLNQAFALDTLVPQTSIQFPVYTQKRLPAGQYSGAVQLSYGSGHSESLTLPLTISSKQVRQTFGSHPLATGGGGSGSSTPILLIALAAVALVAAGVGGSALVFRRRLRAAAKR